MSTQELINTCMLRFHAPTPTNKSFASASMSEPTQSLGNIQTRPIVSVPTGVNFHRSVTMQSQSANYFTLPSLPWMINIFGWLYCGLYSTVFIPHLVPYHLFGPAGTGIRLVYTYCPFFGKVLFVAAHLVHLGEAVYAWQLCRKKGINGRAQVKWFASTAVFGGPSLYELVVFKQKSGEHLD
ncbi:transmembrane protein 254-like isoform X4 [Acanthaster planci]|uniref:Transmembrane protein 254 n=1 Tax=Acanthaster planci TaxID=133434 RepID=A0A8B7Z5J5_ACAPL|nr:transmembrane protein 254-like isoform X4 [Acanthaster planci]